MSIYKIHPIVVGTKLFDKSMMTYQYAGGSEYTIPIYCWYIEGADKKILVDTGEMHPIISEKREKAITGKIYNYNTDIVTGTINKNNSCGSVCQSIRKYFSWVNNWKLTKTRKHTNHSG
jgi:hypothetical protein